MEFNQDKVFEQLKDLRNRSYSPYSNFRVACIIYLKDGKQILGVNVENAAFNPTICAERTALPQMIAQGYSKEDVELIALYTDSEGFGSPCGTCRQTLVELLNEDQKMWVFNVNKYLGEYKVSDFLPYMFTSKDLK